MSKVRDSKSGRDTFKLLPELLHHENTRQNEYPSANSRHADVITLIAGVRQSVYFGVDGGRLGLAARRLCGGGALHQNGLLGTRKAARAASVRRSTSAEAVTAQ